MSNATNLTITVSMRFERHGLRWWCYLTIDGDVMPIAASRAWTRWGSAKRVLRYWDA